MLSLSVASSGYAFGPAIVSPQRLASRSASVAMASDDEFTLAILGDLHVSCCRNKHRHQSALSTLTT